jgi:hypothetical protein
MHKCAVVLGKTSIAFGFLLLFPLTKQQNALAEVNITWQNIAHK